MKYDKNFKIFNFFNKCILYPTELFSGIIPANISNLPGRDPGQLPVTKICFILYTVVRHAHLKFIFHGWL